MLAGIAFFTVFFGAIIFMVIASGKQRKIWRERPAVLRALASRRGYQFVENPGKQSELTPIRPADKEKYDTIELPAAVKGRTLDGTFTLHDLYTEVTTRTGGTSTASRATKTLKYETFMTIKSGRPWPHFEFAVVSHVGADTLTGKLLAMTKDLAAGVMETQRGLKRVDLPEPGSQLYVEDPNSPQAAVLRDTLPRLFAQRAGWWVGGLGDSLTLTKSVDVKSAHMNTFVPAGELDRFIDESMEIERTLRAKL